MRHVLITGGSRGIGLSIARLFASNSYRCTLLSRSEASLKAAVASLTTPTSSSSTPNCHTYISGDITSPSFWTPASLGSHLPRNAPESKIDVLVNCAGITQTSLFVSTPPEELQRVVDTNLTSMMIGTRFFLRGRYMSRPKRSDTVANGNEKEQEDFSPVIINVSSLLGTKGGAGAVAYAASKAGVLGFTRALAAEQGAAGLRVNAIVPGYVETDMTDGLNRSALMEKIPLKRFGRPEEIASAALFLAANQYAHNSIINMDGGLSAI
ncbi:NAD(P)-binding protein [Corynespora cassiicola Philippines]|uniref:NAD(P)-binding protein n=1 Tax=Corynespora cassiicola Philippines TaxID=1448308 RepID=A0A2T2P6L7_CORCC|nr:NAD(P)-binding protein [Corynespora cassiicola Philippines]